MSCEISHSVAVVIYDSNFRVLLQKRDLNEDIYFSNFFGLFGGLCEHEEKPLSAAVREIEEEISLTLMPDYFMHVDFDCESLGFSKRKRTYFTAQISDSQKDAIVLLEGDSYAFHELTDLPSVDKLVPMDLSCLLLFMHRFKLETKLVPRKLDIAVV